MPTLTQLIPDAEVLLRLAPEELAFYVLRAARDSAQNQMFTLQSLVNDANGANNLGARRGGYPQAQLAEVIVAITEA